MSDSQAVDIGLDAFEDLLSGNPPKEKVTAEISEQTPSATENESEPDPEDPEAEAEALEDEDGDDTPEEQDEPEEEAKPKPKKRPSAQERIDELTREKYELKRLLDLERVERNKTTEKPKSEVPTQEPTKSDAPDPNTLGADGEPVYPLGEFDPKFIADLTRYTIKTEREAAKKQEIVEREQEQVLAAQRELTQAWELKVSAAAERLPDLQEKFSSLQETFKDIPGDYGNFLASSIMTLDNGPDVLDYFADHPDEAKKVVSSGPFGAVIALGRLDQKFESAKAVDKGSVIPTQAPSPPPKNRGSAVPKTIRPDTDNLADFEKLLASQKD